MNILCIQLQLALISGLLMPHTPGTFRRPPARRTPVEPEQSVMHGLRSRRPVWPRGRTPWWSSPFPRDGPRQAPLLPTNDAIPSPQLTASCGSGHSFSPSGATPSLRCGSPRCSPPGKSHRRLRSSANWRTQKGRFPWTALSCAVPSFARRLSPNRPGTASLSGHPVQERMQASIRRRGDSQVVSEMSANPRSSRG